MKSTTCLPGQDGDGQLYSGDGIRIKEGDF